MGQQQGQQQGGGGDNAYTPIWIILAIFAVSFLIWHFYHAQIVAGLFYVNLIQANIVSFFTNNLANDIYLMQTADPSTIKPDELLRMLDVVGAYTKYPVIGLLVGLAGWLYFANITLKFKKVYSMKTLREQEQYNWPQIMPITKLDLIKEDINQGPWAMAKSPLEFAKSNNLLKRDEYAGDDVLSSAPAITAGIKRGETKVAFTVQLGPYFKGFEMLPIHLLALAGIFSARINQDRDGADEMLGTISRSMLKGKISFLGAKTLMKKHMGTEIVQQCAQSHAYVLTVMASLLEAARDDGVLASSDFLWLKPLDRRAWYMMNCIGRQTPFAEVSGAFAHWKAEKQMKRKSVVPLVDEAIKALELGVKEVKLSPKELEDL